MHELINHVIDLIGVFPVTRYVFTMVNYFSKLPGGAHTESVSRGRGANKLPMKGRCK